MPAAVALASAREDQELARNIMTAIRLAFAIGLYTEIGDDSRIPGLAIMVVRVEGEAQAEELVKLFPGVSAPYFVQQVLTLMSAQTYISAFTDPRNISVVGPTKQLEALMKYATEHGFMVQPLEIRGKVHNPENMDLADELSALSAVSELLRIPSSDQLQCPVRSNRDGAVIPQGRSLSDDVLYTVLASRSEWYKVLQGVAKDLKSTGVESHNILSLGIGDFIPLMPFNKLGLRAKKVEWSGIEAREERYPYQDDAIAIVGASCRLPGANNMDELWDLLSTKQDRHEAVKPERVDIPGSYRALQSGNFAKNREWYGNFIEGVDRFDRAFFGTNAREMANMDPQQRMLLELAYEAMECYGYTKSHVRSQGDNVGCFIGASFTEYLENAYAHKPTAYTAPGTIRAFLCGRISYYFGWTGPSEVIDTACSASLVAINRAVMAIRGGECPVALAGGVNIISGVHNYLDLARAGFLSATGQCKPWDKDADGYCRSDGVGLVVLKSLKQAQADGDHIMAIIASAATNQGGLSSSITNPDPVQQARLYRNVLDQAAMQPDQVTYIEAHGTGTQAGDRIETSSIREVFGNADRAYLLHIGSIKGNIGHCETAAGVAGLLKVVAMLEHQAIPPQASHKEWNLRIPSLSEDRIALSMKLDKWDSGFRAALVNSFGAAGSNATVLCCEPPTLRGRPDIHHLKHPIILSAQSVSSLNSYRVSVGKYLAKSLSTHKPLQINEVSYTLNEKRRRHKYAIVLEASGMQELAEKLLDNDDEIPVIEPQRKPVILVFGGQSKQTIGLGKSLYDRFPTFKQHLDMCDSYLQQLGYPPILPAVFENQHDLDNIVVLQTAHVAVQYAVAMTWIEAGLQIDGVIGHSLGELSALAISGQLSIHDCLRLVAERASLMQERWGPEHGAMLAVFASKGDIERMIAHLRDSSGGKCTLEIACYNSDTSYVVSGDCASIVELENHISQQGGTIRCTRVDTSHGFHSRLVEPILDDLAEVSASLNWKTGTIPIELCVAENDGTAPFSPSKHAREPVFFADAVKRLERRFGSEGCVWLEAGFDTPIMAMTKRPISQPQQQHHVFLSMRTRDVEVPEDLISRSVCKLWENAQGVIHWSFLSSDGSHPTQVWLPPYAFDHTTAWLENIDRASELQREHHQPIRLEKDSSDNRRMMVTQLPTDEASGTERFRVAAEGERFQTIVAGHAVRGRPLCPASMYLECVAMALQLLIGDDEIQRGSLEFENLEIQAPLGMAVHQQVEIVLQGLQHQPEAQRYQVDFALTSRHIDGTSDKTTLHAKGRAVKSTGTVALRL
jgi:acyl transferase domain-containing protein